MKSYDIDPLVVSDNKTNITDLLVERVANNPKLPLFATEQADGTWHDILAEEFLSQVTAVAKGLIASGIQPGQAVAIMSKTRYEWTLIDFAIWFAGAISVPIYESSSPTQMSWILSDSDSVAVFLETAEHLDRFETIKASVPLARQIWRLDEGVIELLIQRGRDIDNETLEQRRTRAGLYDLATIIYTSGTTGVPKGCELLHRGFVELSKNAMLELPEVLQTGRSTLLFLPLAHVFARFVEVLAIHVGIKVGHKADAKDVGPAMISFHPDFLLAVPRVFEKVYNAAEQKAEAGGKGDIFRKAAVAAIEYAKAKQEFGKVSLGQALQHRVFDALVYRKIRSAMGGQLRYAISGGAPLGSRLGYFFAGIGLTVLEGYGLTETTAPAMIARPTQIKIGKIGRTLPGCGVKIASDGEILLRGNNIMRGYWRNPAATAEAFDGEWFRTGDIGELDEDGFLSITGRKKELLVTAGGTKIAGALVDPDGVIVRESRVPTPATDPDAIAEAVVALIQELSKDVDVVAAGVAAAGFVDAARANIVYAPNLSWRNEPFKAKLEAKLDIPVFIDNDANAAGWAEYRFGAGRGYRHMVMLTIGTGVGGAIIADGRLLRGGFGVAAELGHIRHIPNGRLCGCGRHGCIEQYGSGTALLRSAIELANSGTEKGARLAELTVQKGGELTGVEVYQAITEGDPGALELLSELGVAIGKTIATIAAVLDPEIVVIGGGVSAAGDLLLNPMREGFLSSLSAKGFRPELRIETAQFVNDAGVVGAADLARQELTSR